VQIAVFCFAVCLLYLAVCQARLGFSTSRIRRSFGPAEIHLG
jgi:hypothetical protein